MSADGWASAPLFPKSCRSAVTPSRFRHPTKQALLRVILRSDGVAGSLHAPCRVFELRNSSHGQWFSRSHFRSLFFIVFVLALFGLLGMLFAQKISPAATPSSDSDVRDSLKQFTEVYDTVEQNYAEPVNPDKAIYNGAIPGMLHVLDPHSNFFDPKSYSAAARRTARQVLRRRHDGWPAQQ